MSLAYEINGQNTSRLPHITVPPINNIPILPSPAASVSHTRWVRWWIGLFRLIAFLILEGAFLGLGYRCLFNPIQLNFDLTDREATGGFTVLFILWHSVAFWLGGSIIVDTFSKEWSATNFSSFEDLKPGETDKVSTPLAGFMHRFWHCLKHSATLSFRLAFVASLGMFALESVAPGAINVGRILFDNSTKLEIGVLLHNVSVDALDDPKTISTILLTLHRTGFIVNLEQVEQNTYGFEVQPNWIAAWPPKLGDFNGTVKYPTDVIQFHHECHWEKPQFVDVDPENPYIFAGGQRWDSSLTHPLTGNISKSDLPTTRAASAIIPLFPSGGYNVSPLSAYIFLGANSSFKAEGAEGAGTLTPYAINLEDLPTFYSPTGILGSIPLGLQGNFSVVAPLATVLVCNPRFTLSGGDVMILQNRSLFVTSSGLEAIGNIDEEAINILFSQGLSDAISEPDPVEVLNVINFVSARLFMSQPNVDWSEATNIKPLDVDGISKNMDRFFSSASKGFVEGYRTTGVDVGVPTYETMPLDAVTQFDRLALTTSKSLLFSTTALVAFLGPLLIILHILETYGREKLVFNLHSILFTVDRLLKSSSPTSPDEKF